ncbi:MAG TPA: patatin-like phospholipase family protein [Oligoflexia bacterium]|nr:patatin-like phospholipase family protein [Oligoflexia bacterium]HMR25449.1 patatin-like phospholipase family protein [Oligoflexia bacterium]
MNKSSKVALVLTGGGARSAYQAGALKAIGEIVEGQPFQIYSGLSAGSINCAFLASHSKTFKQATKELWNLWDQIKYEDVFHTETRFFASKGARLLKNVLGGGYFNDFSSTHLLDNSPLIDLLSKNIDFLNLNHNIQSKKVLGMAVTATNYASGESVIFFNGQKKTKEWIRSRRIAVRTNLKVEHIMASSAIPMFFPPVYVDNAYYGDGAMRSRQPLSPAIHLGADSILAIGVRRAKPQKEKSELEQQQKPKTIVMADVMATILNSILLDSLDSDIERLSQINQFVSEHPGSKFKKVPILVIRPQSDLGAIGSSLLQYYPKVLRYLLKGLGISRIKGGDLLSFLSFHHEFTSTLLQLGYQDAYQQKKEIKAFYAQN